MAATYRDHVILCGLGNLGIRVLQQLVAAELDVVVIELCETGRFVAQGKALGVPVLVRDMKDDQALYEAGIEHARAIIICTNDDVGNIEVALDARRMNPGIRIVMRLFEQDVARKIKGALAIDQVFSASSLAAPTIAAMSLGAKVLGNVTIGGALYLIAEVPVERGSAMAERRIEQIETDYSVSVLAITDAHDRVLAPAPMRPARVGERLVVHVPANYLMTIAEAGKSAGTNQPV